MKQLDKFCSKSPSHEHIMNYEYTWLINWNSGFLTNIVHCIFCKTKAQTSTMYEPGALHSLKLKFKEDTIHRRI